MHLLIALLLICTSTAYSSKQYQSPFSIPNKYSPQGYRNVYKNQPYVDTHLYSNSITRTGESNQPDTNVPEKAVTDEDMSSSPNPQESKDTLEETEITITASPEPPKEVQKYEKPSSTSSETSSDEEPELPSINVPPSNTYQERPKYQEDSKLLSNNVPKAVLIDQPKYSNSYKYPIEVSPPLNGHQERPKYSNSYKYPNNAVSLSNNNQEQSKYLDSFKHSNDVLPPSNSYQKRPKNTGIIILYPNDLSPSSKSNQETKYLDNYKYLNDLLLPSSLIGYQKRPKYPDTPDSYKYPKDVSPPSKSYQKQPKYTDKYKYQDDVSPSLNSYQEQPKYTNSYKYPSPSNNYQEWPKYLGDNEYQSNNPPPKLYKKRPIYTKINKYPYYISVPQNSHQERPKYENKYPSKNAYPTQNTYQDQPNYEYLYNYPTNNGWSTQNQYKERPKYPKNNKQQESISSSESAEEQPKNPSQDETQDDSKSYTEQPSSLLDKNTSSSPKISDDDNEDREITPPPLEYLAPQYPDKDSSGPWTAPSFYQSLKDFDEVENIVQSRLFGENKRNAMQYTIIAGVLDGMIKTMTNTPWRYYEEEYDATMSKLFRYGRFTKNIVNGQVKCVYNWIKRSIGKLRAIMSNDWINHICTTSDTSCDTLVLAAVDASNHVHLQKEARLLLALGKAASLFLNQYADTLEQQARTNRPSNLYAFMLESKRYFKPLIQASSEARRLLPPSLNSCEPDA